MRYGRSVVLGCLRTVATVCGSVLLMGALSLSARAGTYQTADADYGGPMIATGNGLSLTVTNTGSQTLTDVRLVDEFVWDTQGQSTNWLPLGWDPGTPNPATNQGSWSLSSPADTFAVTGASGDGATLQTNFWLDSSNWINPILNASPSNGNSENTATIPYDSYVPAEVLGDFARTNRRLLP